MKSGIAAIRANARRKQISAEKNRILTAFATDPHSSYRAVTEVTKTILLNGPYTLGRKLYDIKAKSLGVGVYELQAEEKKNKNV